MEFRTAYERCEHKGITFVGESKTQQHFKDEVDTNLIIERYTRTGYLPEDIQYAAQGVYEDFSEVDDYTAMQNKLAKADQSFMALPSAIRERFGQNPANLIAFLNDSKNYEEAVKLGLVNKRAVGNKVVTDGVGAEHSE